jgi:hypothetical protein
MMIRDPAKSRDRAQPDRWHRWAPSFAASISAPPSVVIERGKTCRARPGSHLMRRSRPLILVVAATMTLAITARADTLPVVGGPLLDAIAAMPEGQWKRVNRNLYSAAWTPAELRPLNHDSNEPPWKIIDAWSGYAWDSRRGDVILYGGGHLFGQRCLPMAFHQHVLGTRFAAQRDRPNL